MRRETRNKNKTPEKKSPKKNLQAQSDIVGLIVD